ncbi:hypothetical protein ACFWSF_15515 [Streptomyces sp. NPDC058611]|uniref:hypothetical protein n=1 Tax=unclassified Streptomyces TaxID=2593676 RepID=UPI00364CBA51
MGMHALQLLPLPALALAFAAVRCGWAVGEAVRTRLVLVAGAGRCRAGRCRAAR